MFDIFIDDGQLLYSSTQAANKLVLSPTCTLEVGAAGAVDFIMLPGHDLYDVIEKLVTKIYVYMDGVLIFKGRILTWSDDFFKQRTVHCEGDLAYLLDTVQPPRKVLKTPRQFLSEIIEEHNMQVDIGKQFTLGLTTINEALTEDDFENTTYRDTRDTIDSDLIEKYGGFLRTRTVGSTTYLDYIKSYGESASQHLTFGRNILDMAQEFSSADIFTVLLPTGDTIKTPGHPPVPTTIESVNSDSKLIEAPADMLQKYGRIVKTENFSGITDPAKLKAKAQAYFNRVFTEPYPIFKIKAIDLHLLDSSIQQFSIGKVIQIISAPHGLNLSRTCLAINYDFENVENTEFTIGKLTDTKSFNLSGKSLSDAVGGGGGGGGGMGQLFKSITETDQLTKIANKSVEILAQRNIDLKIDNNGLKAAINLDESGVKIYGKELEFTGENGFKFTAGAVVDGDLNAVLSDAYSQITANAGEIELKVAKSGIVSAINLTPESIKIKSSKIYLTGTDGIIINGLLVVQSEAADINARIDNLVSGIASFDNLYATDGSITSLIVGVGGLTCNYGTIQGSAISGGSLSGTTLNLSSTATMKAIVAAAISGTSLDVGTGNIKGGAISGTTLTLTGAANLKAVTATGLAVGTGVISGDTLNLTGRATIKYLTLDTEPITKRSKTVVVGVFLNKAQVTVKDIYGNNKTVLDYTNTTVTTTTSTIYYLSDE